MKTSDKKRASALSFFDRKKHTVWGFLVKILVFSVLLACAVTLVASDVLALHTTPHTAEVTVTAEMDTRDYGKALAQAGLVRFAWLFTLDSALRQPHFDLVPGTYTLENNMDYAALRRAVSAPTKVRKEISVTIPPGTTVSGLIRIFTEAGVASEAEFADAINHHTYAYSFLADLPTENKLWHLEGYLFPDTYRVWQDSSAVTVVDKMLANFNRKFDARYQARAAELGLTVDKVVTVASLVQAESRYPDEYGKIAAVFYNRLSGRAYPYLESDATVQYVLPSHKPKLTREDLAVESPYNTYTSRGLPPGAICNPGADALLYALFPAQTRDYFFVSGGGRALFAETYEGQKRNIARIRQESQTA